MATYPNHKQQGWELSHAEPETRFRGNQARLIKPSEGLRVCETKDKRCDTRYRHLMKNEIDFGKKTGTRPEKKPTNRHNMTVFAHHRPLWSKWITRPGGLSNCDRRHVRSELRSQRKIVWTDHGLKQNHENFRKSLADFVRTNPRICSIFLYNKENRVTKIRHQTKEKILYADALKSPLLSILWGKCSSFHHETTTSKRQIMARRPLSWDLGRSLIRWNPSRIGETDRRPKS